MLASIWAVARREFRRIVERKTLYILIIFLPLFLFTLLTLVYNEQIITDIPIAVYDNDNSELSRLLIRGFASTRSVKISGYVSSLDEIKDKMLHAEIQAAIYIPAGMQRDIKRGEAVTIVIYKNASNIIIGNLILKEALSVNRTVAAGILIKKFRAQGLGEKQALNLANPIRVNVQSLGNPGYNYLNYMMPGMLPFILQLVIFISAVLIVSGEFKDGTIADLWRTANGKITAVIAGKLLTHAILHSINVLLLLAIIFPLFGISATGSMAVSTLLMIFFVVVILSIGLMISTLCRDQAFASEIATFLAIPSFIFSGFTYPLWGMPALHNVYAQTMPFTHFLSAFIKVFYLGAPLVYFRSEILILAAFLVGALTVTAIFLRRIRRGTFDVNIENQREN